MAIGIIAQLKIAAEAMGVDPKHLPALFKIKGGGINRINIAVEDLFLVIGKKLAELVDAGMPIECDTVVAAITKITGKVPKVVNPKVKRRSSTSPPEGGASEKITRSQVSSEQPSVKSTEPVRRSTRSRPASQEAAPEESIQEKISPEEESPRMAHLRRRMEGREASARPKAAKQASGEAGKGDGGSRPTHKDSTVTPPSQTTSS